MRGCSGALERREKAEPASRGRGGASARVVWVEEAVAERIEVRRRATGDEEDERGAAAR